MTTPILDVRKIEVAPDHEGRRAYLAQAAEGGRGVEIRPYRGGRLATAYLATDAARLITGQTLYIDGGYYIVE
ncbi:hypothetical protein [Roseomonas chloroacetimidivorans]|uniref:hypothetical protein n=1 Tax=Roseomonas chloroacetimidivorans TaxID=1766656 RepID=UPI003C78DF11